VLKNPADKGVRGWLVFDNFLMTRLCRFNAHSVVAAADGSLFDPTPSRASQRYPFLRHAGADAEFEALIERNRLVLFDYDPDADRVYVAAARAG
jgi:hypothetical protein